MKTVADLKRTVIVGALLTLVSYRISNVDRAHKYMGVPREVTKSNSVGFACKPVADAPWGELFKDAESSYCDWPKKAEYTCDGDGMGFSIDHGHIHLHYRVLERIKPVFRMFPEGDAIALWGEPDSRGLINSYQHIGQHSEADARLHRELRLAKPEEAAPLANELRGRGYHFPDVYRLPSGYEIDPVVGGVVWKSDKLDTCSRVVFDTVEEATAAAWIHSQQN